MRTGCIVKSFAIKHDTYGIIGYITNSSNVCCSREKLINKRSK